MQEALKLADAVSLNLEAPTQKRFQVLSRRKDYIADIVEPMKKLARWTSREGPFSRVGLTTQFVVGAAGESDFELVRTMGALYGKLGLSRAYFSAYQPGGGAAHLPGERNPASMGPDPLTREHTRGRLMRTFSSSTVEPEEPAVAVILPSDFRT